MKSALSDGAVGLSWMAWALALTATAGLLAAVLAPPFLPPVARASLIGGFRALCHQLPERSFFLDGVQLAACHRCMGIYAGLVLGVLSLPALRLPFSKHERFEGAMLLISVVPVALDWGGEVLGLWAGSTASRVATGLWFGVFAGYLFARAVSRRRKAEVTE